MQFFRNFKIFLFLFFVFSASGTFALANCDEELSQIIRADQFMRTRPLRDYKILLSKHFEKNLLNLKPGDVWINSGAGSAVAERDFYRTEKASLGVKTISIGYKKPAWYSDFDLFSFILSFKEDYTYLSGRMIEDIPAAEIPKANLISDLHGPVSYSAQFDQVMEIYLNHLKVGGNLHFFLLEDFIKIEYSFNGVPRRLRFIDFLKMIGGVEVRQRVTIYQQKHRSGLKTTSEYKSFQITKVSDQISIPKLELISSVNVVPPVRYYRLLN